MGPRLPLFVGSLASPGFLGFGCPALAVCGAMSLLAAMGVLEIAVLGRPRACSYPPCLGPQGEGEFAQQGAACAMVRTTSRSRP